jgi:hypothetical protein
VARYTFSNHGLKYDTARGEAKYHDWSSFSFRLNKYLSRTFERCNCHDQASAVQVFAGAVGCSCGWIYLRPFGYINLTSLIGVGPCNNPFFRDVPGRAVVPRFSSGRSSFGNHAFVAPTNTSIVDSCAGPHTGNETPGQYVQASIDADPRLYSFTLMDAADPASADRPGTVADMANYGEVTDVR